MSKNNYDNVFSSVYAGNIDYYAALLKSDHVLLDVHEFYQKQSFRNRCVIAGANGPLNLIVPIQRIGGKSMMKDLKIDHSQNWKKIHWKSLESAYRTSPYFEYYEHEFKPIFHDNKIDFLMDLNKQIMDAILKCLNTDLSISNSTYYIPNNQVISDYRNQIHPKKPSVKKISSIKYIQVFEDKIGFHPNLSMLDLLFNEGPNAIVLVKEI